MIETKVDADGAALVAQTRALGADLAGIARVDGLRTVTRGSLDVSWPEGARSVLVVAVAVRRPMTLSTEPLASEEPPDRGGAS